MLRLHTLRRLLPPVLMLALSSWLLLTALACSDKRSPEQQIKARLQEGVTALEKKDVGAAGALLSEGYKDPLGRDKRQMKGIAFMVLRQGPVYLKLSDEKIEVAPAGDRASVSARVTVLQTAGSAATLGDLVPRGTAVEVLIDLVKEGGAWMVASIHGDGMSADLD
jgi:hypothetical protein